MTGPWMKFYPSDWRSDPLLRLCSIAARGLWMELICLMHEAEPYGHLLVNKKPPTDAQIGALTGIDPITVRTLISELEEAGVFSRNRTGVIYSRRMTADAKKAETARKNGKNGGNPTLCNKTQNPPSDKGVVKGRVNGGDNTQKPEARKNKQETKDPDGSLSAARPARVEPEPEILQYIREQEEAAADPPPPPRDDPPPAQPKAAVVVPLPVIDPRRRVFGECREWLMAATGKSDQACRNLLGKWLAAAGKGNEAVVLRVFEGVSRHPPAGDVVAYINEAVQNESTRHVSGSHHRQHPQDSSLLVYAKSRSREGFGNAAAGPDERGWGGDGADAWDVAPAR